MHTDAEWLGLCCRTESDRPQEWPYIAWVVRNRVESGRFPDTYRDVIRQRLQFSWFNGTVGQSDEAVWEAARRGYPARHPELLEAATACATWVLATPREGAPFGPGVYYFWSPVSMVPTGALPSWARNLRRFTPMGLDPWRFMFAEEAAA